MSFLDRVRDSATGEDTSLDDIVRSLGRASFIPNLMLPALAVISPLSGVPLFSSSCGLLIALVSAQMLARRDHIWLPGFLLRRRIDTDRLMRALQALQTPAGWIDRLTRPRLRVLTRAPVIWLAQLACLLAGLTMPFLELFPFTSTILGCAVLLIALGMLTDDGLFILIAALILCTVPLTILWLIG